MKKRRNRTEEENEDDWEEEYEDEDDWLEDGEEVENDDYEEDEEYEETYFMGNPLFSYIRKNPESVKWNDLCGKITKNEPIVNFMQGIIYKNVALYYCIYPMGIIGQIDVRCGNSSWSTLFSGN